MFDADLIEADYEDIDDDFDDTEDLDADAYDLDDDSLMEFVDDDSELFGRKRRRRRPRTRVKVNRKNSYFNRKLRGYATQTQLKASLAKVGRDVTKNRIAIGKNSGRISAVSRNGGVAIKKVRSEIDNMRQMTMMMSLLGGGEKTYEASAFDNSGKQAENISELKLTPKGSTLDTLLPFMMMGGMGGGGGSNNNMMMMAMLIALDK